MWRRRNLYKEKLTAYLKQNSINIVLKKTVIAIQFGKSDCFNEEDGQESEGDFEGFGRTYLTEKLKNNNFTTNNNQDDRTVGTYRHSVQQPHRQGV